MKILVIGDGLLGLGIISTFEQSDHQVHGTSRKPESPLRFDLMDHSGLNMLPECDWAVVAAAVTGFKDCSENRDSHKVNVSNTVNLVKELNRRGTKVLFPSSSAVFDGTIPFCTPDAEPSPVTEYARQKVEVETAVLASSPDNLVVRLTKILDWRSGIILNWVKSLSDGSVIRAFDDLNVAPLLLNDVTLAMLSLMERGESGIFHFSPPDQTSYYDLALDVCRFFACDPDLVERIPCRSYVEFAPLHATLDCSSTKAVLGYAFSGTEAVSRELFQKIRAAEAMINGGFDV